MSKELFKHTFPNGVTLEVNDKGFVVWDDHVKRWTVDASCLVDENEIIISNEIFDKVKYRLLGYSKAPFLPARYPPPKQKRKKV